jgi:superfamily II RNA helicase
MEALRCIQEADVLVCAPTGSGKTWIAVEAIGQRLQLGLRSWYASPLKALSNAKYEEFRQRFGRTQVGILTGDRKENPEAPVIVGTTEILRNHLYDAMDRGQDLDVDMVVIDEAHYLNDPERGVVWEEVLIYLPSRVRILMLSATVGNPREICQWLETHRGSVCQLVEAIDRPVPLHVLFLHPDGCLCLLMGRHGLHGSVQRFLQQQSRLRRPSLFWELEEVAEGLRELGLLPAIFFLKSRADCDRAVESYGCRARGYSKEEEMYSAAQPFLREYPWLEEYRHFEKLIKHRVAAHHAGHLPHWKLLVEGLMNMGCLNVIFATSTVAAGVDFPARTAVLIQSDRFNGREFTELTATELRQMTGRAGRRGKDKVGFALIVPGPFQDVRRIAKLVGASPESIRSQIQINFSMVLNLLLSHPPDAVRTLLRKSLAAFQQAPYHREPVGPPGDSRKAEVSFLARRLSRGRLFLHKDGSVHVAFRLKARRGNTICMSQRLDRKVKIRKGRPVLKGIPLDQIEVTLEKKITLPDEVDLEGILAALEDVEVERTSEGPSYDRLMVERGSLSWRAPYGERGLWEDFQRHLQFLRETGFVDEQDRLTADGRWASRLRLDHPIVVAEAIRQGLLDGFSSSVIAGLIAPFVTDREREIFVADVKLEEMGTAYDAMVAGTLGIRKALEGWGFGTPLLQFWPAVCLCLWAEGMAWTQLCKTVPLDEGDLVALIVRTADHLRQICDLVDTHPVLAKRGRSALERIQREPAIYV